MGPLHEAFKGPVRVLVKLLKENIQECRLRQSLFFVQIGVFFPLKQKIVFFFFSFFKNNLNHEGK